MQTFLPFQSFSQSALALDDKRLGKQRVETLQILKALREPNYGWKHHPAVRMWAGYEYLLTQYGNAMCGEWVRRGFQDTCGLKINAIQIEIYRSAASYKLTTTSPFPWWYGDARLHTSHQSNLLRKDPTYYTDKFPGVPHDLPYFWPTKETPLAA